MHSIGTGGDWVGISAPTTAIFWCTGLAGFRDFGPTRPSCPDRGVGVIVLTNAAGAGSTLADAVATSVYDILLAKPEIQRRLDSAVAATRASAAVSENSRREISRNAVRAGRRFRIHWAHTPEATTTRQRAASNCRSCEIACVPRWASPKATST